MYVINEIKFSAYNLKKVGLIVKDTYTGTIFPEVVVDLPPGSFFHGHLCMSKQKEIFERLCERANVSLGRQRVPRGFKKTIKAQIKLI